MFSLKYVCDTRVQMHTVTSLVTNVCVYVILIVAKKKRTREECAQRENTIKFQCPSIVNYLICVKLLYNYSLISF